MMIDGGTAVCFNAVHTAFRGMGTPLPGCSVTTCTPQGLTDSHCYLYSLVLPCQRLCASVADCTVTINACDSDC